MTYLEEIERLQNERDDEIRLLREENELLHLILSDVFRFSDDGFKCYDMVSYCRARACIRVMSNLGNMKNWMELGKYPSDMFDEWHRELFRG